ncbi:MAG: menaquinone biosynthesis protein [Thermodesulfobacteriota bacterium]
MIKLGSVSFLNAQPLTYAIENNLISHGFELIQTPPSELSEKLQNKYIDVGLIPVAELLQRKHYRVVPNISISSIGKVDSVIVLAKSDIKNLKTVAVDKRSQSSTALLRIVLELFNDIKPEYISSDIDKEDVMDSVDGAMLIGDSGLRRYYDSQDTYKLYDLGEIWTNETGLPFVYAVFAVRDNVILEGNLNALIESKNYGLGAVDKIAKLESEKMGMDYDICLKYLTQRIKYDLGREEIKGIIKYSELLSKLNLAQEISDLNLYTE